MALSKRQVYLFGASASAVGRAVELPTGFATIWILTHTLTKEDYGHYVLAFAVIELIALLASGGLENVVLYRSSRLDEPPGRLAGGPLVAEALTRALGAALLAAAGVWLAAPFVAELFGKPEAAGWIRGLALLLPLWIARNVTAAWHRGRQRLAQAVLVGHTAPRVVSLLLLVPVWLLMAGRVGVVLALFCGSLVTLAAWIASAPPGPPRLRGEIDAWDVRYGLKLMLTALLSRGSRSVEILLLGALATAAATAQYSVAASLASLVLLPHTVLVRIFAPRLGALHARGEPSELRREYDQNRVLALSCALAASAALALVGEPLLGLFGDFRDGQPIVLILCAGLLTQASLGMNGIYLVMGGRGGWTLATNLLFLASSVGLNAVLIPRFGALGAASAAFGSIVLVRGVAGLVVWRLDRFATWSAELAVVTVSAVALLWMAALGSSGGVAASGGLLVLLGFVLFRQREYWLPELARLRSRGRVDASR